MTGARGRTLAALIAARAVIAALLTLTTHIPNPPFPRMGAWLDEGKGEVVGHGKDGVVATRLKLRAVRRVAV